MQAHSLLKIGEFARLGNVSIATLRYYDQWNLLKPNALDADTGYRYYSLDQLPRLHRIVVLKELGFPLEHVALLLEKDLPLEHLQGMFELQYTQTLQMIEKEQARLLRIATRLRHIEQEGTMPTYDIRLKSVEPQLVASIREIIPLGIDLVRPYSELADYLKQHSSHTSLPFMRLLYSRYKWYDNEMGIDIETAIPLTTSIPEHENIRVRTLDGGLMAYTLHIGSDIAIGQAHVALLHWLQENNYQLVGPPRHIFLQYEENTAPNTHIAEIQFPIRV